MKRKYKKERQRLLNEIITTRLELNAAKAEIEMLNDKLNKLSSRLETAGSEIETIDNGAGPIQVIHAEAQAWGQYFHEATFTEEGLPQVKKLLIENIVKGLTEANIIQFIIKCREDPLLDVSIGAKLFVIPWEQLRTKSIDLKRIVDKED